jgi:N-acetylmuramoyl-L-alanine amidase
MHWFRNWRRGIAATGMMRGCLSLVLLGPVLYSPASVAKTTHVTHHHVAASSARHASAPTKHARQPLASRHSTTHASTRQAHHVAGRKRIIEPARIQTDRPLIVIDPGHGGSDPGAIGVTGTEEKTITLATAQELQHTLSRSGRYRIALTRTGDRSVSLAERLAFARKRDADLLIAIHADASRDHRARGASVYISSNDVTTHFAADKRSAGLMARAMAGPEPEPGSAWLQYTMIDQLADDVRMTDSPARHAHLYVLASHRIPSVLLEVGFLSNRQDESLLGQAAHRRVLVQAISDAIDDYFAAFKEPASRT